MKQKLLSVALGALMVGSIGLVSAAPASAASGSCQYALVWSASSRSATASGITCTGTRKVRAVIQFYSSPSGQTLYTAAGPYAGTGGVSHVSEPSPTVVVNGYGQLN